MKTIVKLALAVTLLMGFAAPAAATSITVNSVSVSFGEVIHINTFLTGAGNTFVGKDVNTGQLLLNTNIGSIGAWCIDLFHNIGSPPPPARTFETIPLATDNSGTSTATSTPLLAAQSQLMQNLAAYGNAQLPSQANKNAFAAAVAMEIWLIEYPTLTFSGGSAAFLSALAAIQAIVLTLPNVTALQLAELNGAGADIFQLQHVEIPVPEPGTLALVGSVLLALGLLRRRLRVKATTSI